MALAEKDSVIAELFGPRGAAVYFVDIFDAPMDAVQAEFHKEGIRQQASVRLEERTAQNS